MQAIIHAAIVIATAVSILRTGWVVMGFVRTVARSRASADIKWDWAFFLVAPEVMLPAIVALWLFSGGGADPPYTVARALLAPIGAAAALGGLGLTVWSWVSLPSVGTGHYLLEGQPLITSGAYGFVRHPIYTGAVLIWLGLAAAYLSGLTLLLTMVYVVPAYLVYIKSEERMLLSRYGEEYRAYRAKVGALIPRAKQA